MKTFSDFLAEGDVEETHARDHEGKLQRIKHTEYWSNTNDEDDDNHEMTVHHLHNGAVYGHTNKFDFVEKNKEKAHSQLKKWGYTHGR